MTSVSHEVVCLGLWYSKIKHHPDQYTENNGAGDYH